MGRGGEGEMGEISPSTSVTSVTESVAELPSVTSVTESVAELSYLRCYDCFMGLESSRQPGLFAIAIVAVQYTFFDSFVDFAVSL